MQLLVCGKKDIYCSETKETKIILQKKVLSSEAL